MVFLYSEHPPSNPFPLQKQHNSYENQVNYYTERINKEPDWTLVHIFADRGITGTSMKKRDEFNKMIQLCKQGEVDMIICKSISRFARNTVDCLKYTRMLKDICFDFWIIKKIVYPKTLKSFLYFFFFGSVFGLLSMIILFILDFPNELSSTLSCFVGLLLGVLAEANRFYTDNPSKES